MDRIRPLDPLDVARLARLGGELGGLAAVELAEGTGGRITVLQLLSCDRLEEAPAYDLEALLMVMDSEAEGSAYESGEPLSQVPGTAMAASASVWANENCVSKSPPGKSSLVSKSWRA